MNTLRSARTPYALALLLTIVGLVWTVPAAAQQDFFLIASSPCRQYVSGPLDPELPNIYTAPLMGAPCNVPANATAVVLNVTVIAPATGHLVIYPTGGTQPGGSPPENALFFDAGRTRAKNYQLELLPGGQVSFYASYASPNPGKYHVIIDISGYFESAPKVTSSTPEDGATNVAPDANIVINFSENVNVTASAFTLECPAGSPVAFTVTPAPPGGTNSFTLDPSTDLPLDATCTVTVTATEVTDTDGDDPPDAMEADYTFSFSTFDAPPSVTNTSPANGATGVDIRSDITVNFNENVDVTASAFTLECPVATPVAFTLTPAPPGAANSFTLDPTSDLPDGVVCTVTVVAAEVTDTDTDDPPDTMAADYIFTFTPQAQPPVVTTTAGATSFTEEGGPVVVDSGVTVTDPDSANLASATVTITNPQDGAAEVLAATACAGLTVTPGLNSLSITGSQPPATYQTCLQSVTYDNTSSNPDTTTRVISFVANDGTSSSTPATKNVTMGTVDNAPVVTTTAGTTPFTEDGGAVVVDSGVTVTDVDSANLASATVTITNPQDGAAEVLAATACAGLTVTPGLNSLSITGSQPLATYQSCLQSVTYNNTSQNPGTTARVISFVANDGTSSSTPATKTVTVAGQNDAPVVTTTGGTTAFTEDGGAVAVDAGVTVTDDDDANLESATVTITNPQDGAAEVLAATSCAGLTVTPGLNTLSITGSQPLATYQTCLQSVTYNNTSNDPNTTARVISFVVNDGTASSTPATKTVTVAAAPDAPVVTTTGGTTAFTEDGGAVVVDAGVTVSDVDSTNLASATVAITNPQDGAAEVLGATSCAGLTVTPGLNSLSITGSQPLATYQTCLQSVTYNNTSQNPGTTARVISFVANDGAASSTPATKTVTVAAVPDAPVVTTTGGTTGFTEDGGAVVVDSGVSVTDADSANLASATVTITNPQDGASEVLAATSCAGLTVTPGLNSLSITGSQPPATYQTCLRSVTYNNTSQNPDTTARVVSFVANDGTASSAPATKTVTVAANPDAPVVTTTGGTTGFTEDGGAVAVDSGVTVTDVDSANLASATVTITNPQDGAAEVLGATSCAGLTVTPGLNSLSLTGSQPLATYQTCLQSVTYNNTSQNPGTTARVVSFVVNDGAASSTPATKTVTVTAVPDAPVVTTTGGTTSFTEDGGAVVVDSGVTVSDVDSTNLASATMTITNPQDGAAEVLGATSCAGLTVTPGLNSLSITGSQPLATYQTCLRSVTYNNSSQSPNATNRVISFVVNDGSVSSTPATKTVTVTPVPDPPTPTVNPVTYTTPGHTQLHVGGLTLPGVASWSDAQTVLTKAAPIVDPDGPVAATVVPASGSSANGGTYSIDSNGRFTYVPPVNFTGTDSFTYQLTDTEVTSAAFTIQITVGPRVWYVRDVIDGDNPSGGDDGRSTNPFDSIAELNAVTTNNGDIIFVFEGNTGTTPHVGSITLRDGQKLWGQGIALNVPGFGTPLVSAAGLPRIRTTTASTDVVTVPATAGNRSNVEIRGLDLEATGATSNAIDVTSSGGNTVGITISNNNIRGATAEGIDLTAGATAAFTATVQNNTVTSAGNGIDTRVSAAGTTTVTASSNMITSTAGNAFDARTLAGASALRVALDSSNVAAAGTGIFIDGSAAGTTTITSFANNTVDGNSAGTGISVTSAIFDGTPGGTFQTIVAGNTAVGGAGNGVGGAGMVLTNVQGDVNFGTLNIFADGGAGLRASSTTAYTGTAGLRLTATGATAIIEATGGPVVDITQANLSFDLGAIKSTNSPTTGLALNSVTGSFAAASGSSISNITSAAGTAFQVGSSSATVTFPGTITTTQGKGVDLTSNTGTISLTGTLNLSSGTQTAFNATGGGTVTATNTSNTLTSGTGTALNVANTTIGAGGLRFRSISANGAASGIVLNNTGSSGNLAVLGSGTADSGGIIQNTTSHGVSLTSTLSPSFTRMRIQNTVGSGIKGTQVTNFTFTNGTIDTVGTGLGAETSNIAFNNTAAGTENNLSGTVTITGNTLTNAYYHGVDIFNFNGTIADADISNNTITSSNSTATSKGSGIRFIAFGSATTVANVTRATIANNIVSNFPSAAGIMVQGGNGNAAGPAGVFGTAGSGTNIIAITGNRVSGFSSANRIGTQAILAVVNGKGQGNFNISNNGTVANPLTNTIGTTLALSSLGQAVVTANVTNNVIVANNTAGANGIGAGTSQTFAATDAPSLTVTISNNQISQTDGNGILVTARDATGTVRAKIQNNTVAAPLAGNRNGIRVDAGNAVSINDSVCLNISGNTSAGVGLSPEGIGLRKQGTVASTNNFALHGLATSPANQAQTAAYVTSQNPGSASGTLIISGDNFNSPTCSFP